ncbi:hypothetical protein AVEN_197786-1 [Araneus ventricosus]|uniref:Histone-lysine N-methyltransferase SETMAR n=1 Tax=Araneus ventricosus TaxID=182803 RepID=A0A4Y2HMY3_ARAVE|nr:hypothetical protein AVEN_197786-1 [Araneus ventricosus]
MPALTWLLQLKNCWINSDGKFFIIHPPHTAAATQELVDQFGWEFFYHSPYSPDLAPSDFHLFRKLKKFLGDKRFGSDEELENAVNTWLNELAAEEYDMGILKLVDRYDKCLNVGGDYVEKSLSLRYVTELFFQ